MGQQYNKVIKRRRRRAYLERVKARIKSARSSKKKSSKKGARLGDKVLAV